MNIVKKSQITLCDGRLKDIFLLLLFLNNIKHYKSTLGRLVALSKLPLIQTLSHIRILCLNKKNFPLRLSTMP